MMKRYFFKISYDGSPFSGWQKQSNANTVQECVEQGLSKLLRQPMDILGCGRTDAGVHASDFYFHVDLSDDDYNETEIVYKLNKIMPPEISVNKMISVHKEAHARFDATSRAYCYRIHFKKNPFERKYSFRYNQSVKPDFELMQDTAKEIVLHNSFFPFCKTHSDVLNYNCNITRSEWLKVSDYQYEFHIQANRFLRGMVRLIVGACLNIGTGKLKLQELNAALKRQERLQYALSVPANGLTLASIEYPYIKRTEN